MPPHRSGVCRIALVGLFSGVLAFVMPTSTARASCVAPEPLPKEIAASAAVFVGTVAAVENQGTWAIVDVIDVWKGDVDDRVEVRAGPKDPPGPISVATSVDRSYREGKTYLFLPHAGSGERFKDNACTATSVYRPELERLRPAYAADPSPSQSPSSDPEPPPEGGASTFVFIGVGGAVVALAVLAARKLRADGGSAAGD